MMKFSVLSLNIWGLPFGIAADKVVRVKSIGEALFSTGSDIICLQEVWTKVDYNLLKDYLKKSHPYYHYFYSGLIGSGLCIFSKWPIVETFYYQFPINGLFHMIHHGDWLGGKGVGLAIIKLNGLRVNIYNTHLHANYSSINGKDSYYIDRLIQCFDTALFIKHTSGKADLSIFSGDLNSTPNEICVEILRELANLEDTWALAKVKEEVPETNDCLRNTYRQKNLAEDFRGLRIDHIFLRKVDNTKVDVEEWTFPLERTVPGFSFSYSDHEAIAAKFWYHGKIDAQGGGDQHGSEERKTLLKKNLDHCLNCCREEIYKLNKSIQMLISCMFFLFAVLLIVPFAIMDTTIVRLFYTIIAVLICFHIAKIVTRWHDLSWLKNAKKRFKVYVSNLKDISM